MKKRLLSGLLVLFMCLTVLQGTDGSSFLLKALASDSTASEDIEENVTLNVDVMVDDTLYEDGLNGVTYDVTIGSTKMVRGVSSYYEKNRIGLSYRIDNICLDGCYVNNGSASLEGTLDGNIKVVIRLQSNHTWDSGTVFEEASCEETGRKVYMCTVCGATKEEAIPALGHTYKRSFVTSACDGSAYYADQCTRCGEAEKTLTTDSVSYTDWSTTRPDVDEALIQQKTVYRYQDAVYGWVQSATGTVDYASYNGSTTAYSYPSGINTSSTLYKKYDNTPVSASNNGSTKVTVSNTQVGYIYWHWCYGTYTAGPINRKISNKKTDTYPSYHEFYSTSDFALTASANARKCSNASVCKDTYWWLNERVPIKRCSWTRYSWQKTGYGSWSAWQDDEITSTSDRNVEKTTMYRYASNASITTDKHIYGAWTAATDANGNMVYEKSCVICGDKVQESNPADLYVRHTAHQFNTRQTIQEQTCHSYGIIKYLCTTAGCSAYEISTFAPLSHSWNTVVNKATASSDGLITKSCQNCDAVEEQLICKVADIALQKKSLTYTGKELKPKAKVTDSQGTVLIEDEDYKISYADNVKVGTAIATITGTGNYDFTKQLSFTITKAVAKKTNKITASGIVRTYAAKAQTVAIKASNTAKAAMTYSSNNAKVKVNSSGKLTIAAGFIGKASITIKAKSTTNYNAARKTITVTVNPKAPAIKKVTSPSSGKIVTTWSKVKPVTRYQIQFSKLKTFKKGSSTSTIRDISSAYAKSTMTGFPAGTWYVRLRTYKTVNAAKYYSAWSSLKRITVR